MSRIKLASLGVRWHALNEGKGVTEYRQPPRPSKTQGVPPRLFIDFIARMFPIVWLLAGCAEQKPGAADEPKIPKGVRTMQLTSTAFKEGKAIPETHAYENKNLSPPLEWSDVPAGVKSLALIC